MQQQLNLLNVLPYNIQLIFHNLVPSSYNDFIEYGTAVTEISPNDNHVYVMLIDRMHMIMVWNGRVYHNNKRRSAESLDYISYYERAFKTKMPLIQHSDGSYAYPLMPLRFYAIRTHFTQEPQLDLSLPYSRQTNNCFHLVYREIHRQGGFPTSWKRIMERLNSCGMCYEMVGGLLDWQ